MLFMTHCTDGPFAQYGPSNILLNCALTWPAVAEKTKEGCIIQKSHFSYLFTCLLHLTVPAFKEAFILAPSLYSVFNAQARRCHIRSSPE